MKNSFGFAVVTQEEAQQKPYPFVYIEKDGSYSELNEAARQYLETVFHPGDGARPYVKRAFTDKTADGNLSGFLERRLLPKGTKKLI